MILFFRLVAHIEAVPPPIVTWYVNGMEIKPSPHYEIHTEPKRSELLIINVSPEDTGEYTCRVKSDIGEATCTSTVYVGQYTQRFNADINFSS